MSSKDNLALDLEHGVRRWDRARWISVFSSHNPTIREVTECLGLGLSASSSTTNRGIPKFDNPDYRKLSSEVTRLSKALPKERDALLDFAADPHSLDDELDELLATYGPAIWGKDADRTCLLTPDSTKKTYTKDLFYDDPEHKEILRTHLHRWIVIKACYYIRNMKLKRPSGTSEYDTLADIDGDSQLSPRGTPNSLSTPEADASGRAEYEVKPVNYKKRKNEAVGSFSDGEEHSASPAKRPYSTLPIKRTSQSPRKSLHNLLPGGLGSMENVPPLPSPKNHLSPSPTNGVDSGRVQLSPVSGNELNGASRPPSSATSTAPNGFTAVNGGFTAVNGTPPKAADPVPEVARIASPKSQRPSTSHHHRDSNSYTSPYEATPNAAAAAERDSDPRSPPPPSSMLANPPPSTHAFQSVNTPAVANGTSDREVSRGPSVHSAQSPPPGSSPTHPDQLAKNGAQRQSAPRVQPRSHTPSQPQNSLYQHPRPPSRTNTPGDHSFSRPPNSHSSHKSYNPTAPGASTQPPPAPNTQAAPGPALQTAPTYGMTLVPTQPHPTTPITHAQLPHKAHQHHHQPQPPRQPVLLSQPVESAMPHYPSKKPAISEHEFRLLQCSTTTALLQYFFPRSTPPPDESAILHTIHHLWYHGEPYFRPELSTAYDSITFVLTSWIQERAAISGLQHHLSSQPGLPLSSPVLVDRLLAMNDIRVMRLKWKNMSTVDGVSPEDLLVRAFMTVSGTEGTEFLWKEGLRGAERGVFEWLKGEDAKMRIGMFKR